jgi:NitT/TauT family transport system ATP-binding protein
LRFAGRSQREADAVARQWLDRVGLGRFANHYPAQLSGGMRKRVALAQNWILDRPILLMDEPFAALDVHSRLAMERELLDLWSGSDRAVLFVTHEIEEAIALADEVVVLSAGPASRVIGRYPVELPRPRDLIDVRTDRTLMTLARELWNRLRVDRHTGAEVRQQPAGALKAHERT